MNKTIALTCDKSARNRLNSGIVEGQLKKLAARAIGKALHKAGWSFGSVRHEVSDADFGYLYTGQIQFRKDSIKDFDDKVFDSQYAEIQRRFFVAGKPWGWRPEGDASELPPVKNGGGESEKRPPAEPIKIKPLNLGDNQKWFAHIYDRDAQIRIINDAIQAAIRSDFQKRSHCICFGAPACGKTETLLAFIRMLGEENCLKLDATATTKAGAENYLLELDPVPPFLVIEEIEKCNPANLPWLLGVLDNRGEIRKTNARIGTRIKAAKCLCLATVNDLPMFNQIMSGALSSRFQNKVFFPRPSRAIMEKILMREIKATGGKTEWIQPALDFGAEENVNDPRRLIALLDGGDRLLGKGEYQNDLRKLRQEMEQDEEFMKAAK